MSDPQDQRNPASSIDPNRPNVARIFNALLGGKDNYQVDRDVRDKLLKRAPALGDLARDVRAFAGRVTRFLAAHRGVQQFLDCAPGLPNTDNTHEIVQRENREATVVYAATDPVVLAHGRALLAENDQTHFVEADFRNPERLFEHPTIRKFLDLSEPVAVFHIGSVQYVSDARNPRDIVAGYIDRIPSGSYIVLAHAYDPEDGSFTPELREIYQNSEVGLGHFRTRAEILSYLDGLELVEPGLVAVSDWWPDGPRLKPQDPVQRLALGAVARKP
ncbi:SAM-dependent methyltransferase [Kibdelosporangium aridum]|uniref:S-adenosyl methyltransferase n=1 Tax=Kibdelosporangium aridum TaxID=2030 RepID=A0A1W2AWB8_KIBAR|nr:SAM-dependent methyltransferase [Kibdelosporangium aridum]SMC64498.1 S-adenosyl methyltransferase [Kibdelosporangium aridum]